MTIERLTRSKSRVAVQFRDQSRDVGGEEVFRNGDLGHLERDIAPMADDLRADLDQLLLRLVSDQSLIGSGVANVRRKLPRL